jgi:hypothetical protein
VCEASHEAWAAGRGPPAGWLQCCCCAAVPSLASASCPPRPVTLYVGVTRLIDRACRPATHVTAPPPRTALDFAPMWVGPIRFARNLESLA